jgi:hypothetical protein
VDFEIVDFEIVDFEIVDFEIVDFEIVDFEIVDFDIIIYYFELDIHNLYNIFANILNNLDYYNMINGTNRMDYLVENYYFRYFDYSYIIL